MVLVKLKDLTPDAMIMFTVNRLDEYRFNYDNNDLLQNILDDFKLGSRNKKLLKIKAKAVLQITSLEESDGEY